MCRGEEWGQWPTPVQILVLTPHHSGPCCSSMECGQWRLEDVDRQIQKAQSSRGPIRLAKRCHLPPGNTLPAVEAPWSLPLDLGCIFLLF